MCGLQLAVDGSSDAEAVAKHFPFTDYFASAPQPLFKKASFDEDWQAAEGCFRHLKTMFKVLPSTLIYAWPSHV